MKFQKRRTSGHGKDTPRGDISSGGISGGQDVAIAIDDQQEKTDMTEF